MKIAVIVTGIPSIDRKLKRLEPRVQKKVVVQSMRSGLKVMAMAVKAQVPVDTGLTRSSVKVRAIKSRRRGKMMLEVAIKGKVEGLTVHSAYGGKPFFYPAGIEYGHGNVPANPFMRRAYRAQGETARKTTMDALIAGIDREISQV